MTEKNNKVILMILDGWGVGLKSKSNAIELAKKDNFDYFWKSYPHTLIEAAGESVGLPKGQMGNSEVGHMAIGSGRVILQYLPRISKSIEDHSFYKNKVLRDLFLYTKENNTSVHLLGLIGDGGVHAHQKHLFALLEMAKKNKVKKLFIHCFTDGRDVEPQSAKKFIRTLESKIKELGIGSIATISGRYYAMDRDKRWTRTKKSYDALVIGKGLIAKNAIEAVNQSYYQGINDEFIEPTIINKEGLIQDRDAIIFFNFRNDRPRQLSKALILPSFKEFKRGKVLKNLYFVTMMSYEKDLPVKGVVFEKDEIKNGLTEIVAFNKLKQFHIAETEKYPHVTFFFNGEKEKPYPKEDRLMIPSPKVKTYDLRPEMSAFKVTKEIIKRLESYNLIIVNFANADMVGHTGDIKATKKAVETIDECLGKIARETLKKGVQIIVIGDHGNAEKMKNANGTVGTAHTTNKVPFLFIGEGQAINRIKNANLADIAPTVLHLLGIKKIKEMTGESLLVTIK